jgi:hypothetical protein
LLREGGQVEAVVKEAYEKFKNDNVERICGDLRIRFRDGHWAKENSP